MSSHLPWNDVDTHGINLILNEWARKGFEGELNTDHSQEGYISITTLNWVKSDSSYVMMELHKLRGKKGFFGQKTNWVVRLFSCSSFDGAFSEMHGCVQGVNMLNTLDRAVVDVGYGFASTSSLEQYFHKGT